MSDRPARGPAAARLALAAGCLTFAGPAAAGEYKPDPAVPLASCAAVGAEADPDGRDGIAGRACAVAPGLAVAVLSHDAASWPVVSDRPRGRTSLEDPIARRVWFPDTSPPRVRYTRDGLVVLRDARGGPVTAYYTGFVSRTDAPGNVDVFVAIRLRPEPCALAVASTEAEARRVASRDDGPCLAPVEAGRRGE